MRAVALSASAVIGLIWVASCAADGDSAPPDVPRRAPVQAREGLTIPRAASGPIELRARGMRLGISWWGALDVEAELHPDARGATYRGALVPSAGARADIDVAWDDRGVEDAIHFAARPDEPVVRYAIDLEGVAGLRLVDDVLELLDDGGAPRLRMGRATIEDGERRVRAHTSIDGCAHSTDPRAPWGRPVVPPGASRCVVSVRWDDDGLRYPATLDPLWSTTGDMPEAHIDRLDQLRPVLVQGGAHAGKVFVAGGTDSAANGGTILDAATLFDPATDSWAAIAPLPAPRRGAIFAYVDAPSGPAILVAGGCLVPCNSQPTSWLYDLATGVYAQAGDLNSPRSAALQMRLPDGRVLVTGGGGISGQPIPVTTEVFDPMTGAWSLKAPRPSGRVWGSSAVLPDGRFLIAGGRDFIAPGVLATGEVYDPVADTWTPTGDMNVDRFFFDFVTLDDGRVIGVGGETQLAYISEVERFDPATMKFELTGELTEGVVGHCTSKLSNGFVAAISNFGGDLVQIFDPAAESWSLGAPLPEPWWDSGVLTLADGRLLLAGGVLDAEWPAATNHALILSPEDDASACLVDGECSSGHCVDGVCCDTACDAACTGCTAAKKGGGADGVCGAVTAGVDDARCGDESHTCGATGACAAGGVCALVASGESCFGCPVNQAGSCDGAGVCVCTGPRCIDDHTLQTTNGPVIDCGPYLCAEDDCRHGCNTSTECAEGWLCDASHQCVFAGSDEGPPPSPKPKPVADGCSASPGPPNSTAQLVAWAAALGLACSMAARRRSRRRGGDRSIP